MIATHACTHVKNASPIIIFVKKIFVNERLIMKITKILYHENLELYGTYTLGSGKQRTEYRLWPTNTH